MTQIGQQVAQALLNIEAVAFSPSAPVTFKSGIVSPIYVDNRRLPYHPQEWHQVIRSFQQAIDERNLEFDVIAGIETGGIPHSAALAYATRRPSVFVRKQIKEHGMKRRVEGGEVADQRVLLIEDTITTGGSSLSGVEALRTEGAQVVACLAIFSYGFAQSLAAFQAADLPLITLATLRDILEVASASHALDSETIAAVSEWQRSQEN